MMDYTKITLGALLTSNEETIRRNAMSILKYLQKNKAQVIDDIEEYNEKVERIRIIK